MSNFSFERGMAQVRKADEAEVKQKIMAALGITSRQSFWFRLKGDIEPKWSEKLAIEEVFNEYGIIEIWGNDENSSEVNKATV